MGVEGGGASVSERFSSCLLTQLNMVGRWNGDVCVWREEQSTRGGGLLCCWTDAEGVGLKRQMNAYGGDVHLVFISKTTKCQVRVQGTS